MISLDTTQLQTCHGWRTVENLRRFIPSITDEELPNEVRAFEGRISQIAEEAMEQGKSEGQIVAMPGAKQLLNQVSLFTPQLHDHLLITSFDADHLRTNT
jgi:hypothetical protein